MCSNISQTLTLLLLAAFLFRITKYVMTKLLRFHLDLSRHISGQYSASNLLSMGSNMAGTIGSLILALVTTHVTRGQADVTPVMSSNTTDGGLYNVSNPRNRGPIADLTESDTEDGCKEGCFAEPNPPWETAKASWGVAWEVHVYGLGAVFALVALYSGVSVVRLWRRKNLLSRGYFISLSFMLLFLSVSRTIFLLVDGYNSHGTFHPAAAYFLGSIAFPCLTSAFSILFLALLKTLKVQMLSPSVQKPPVLVAIIVMHFILSLVTDIVVGYFYMARALVFACQLVSILWCLALSVGYFYIFSRLYTTAKHRQNEITRITSTMSKVSANYTVPKAARFTGSLAIKVTFVTACLGLVQAAIHIYSMVDVVNFFTNNNPDAWPWWGMHFGLRLTEISMCLTMTFVATQPFRHQTTRKHRHGNRCCSSLLEKCPCVRDVGQRSSDVRQFDDLSISGALTNDQPPQQVTHDCE